MGAKGVRYGKDKWEDVEGEFDERAKGFFKKN